MAEIADGARFACLGAGVEGLRLCENDELLFAGEQLARHPSEGELRLTARSAGRYTWWLSAVRSAALWALARAVVANRNPIRGSTAHNISGVFEMIKATLLRPGMIIKHENDLCVIYSVDHRTPGNKRGSMQTRMRNLRNGDMMDYRFRAEEFVEKVVVDEIDFEFLYSDGDGHHFMNTENYEQLALQDDIVGDTKDYLIPNLPRENRVLRREADRRAAAGYGRPEGGGDGADHSESHRQRGDEAGETRNGAGGERAAVCGRGRQDQGRYVRRRATSSASSKFWQALLARSWLAGAVPMWFSTAPLLMSGAVFVSSLPIRPVAATLLSPVRRTTVRRPPP